MEKLLIADWGDKWGKPLTAEELLEIGRKEFEPLFQQPPIGPIPEYLKPHSSFHGCVADYEDKLDELEKWKARKLASWLKDKIGQKYHAGDRVYELHVEKEGTAAQAKYSFKLIKDQSMNRSKK
ncbi:MAG: hypothetical protein PVF76_03540 [Syntrophobacterales bacterium]